MSEYNAYSTLLQSSQADFVSSDNLDSTVSHIPSNNTSNNMMYNTAPLIFLNPQKSDVGLIQNSVINDGSTYLTIQTQPNPGSTELSGAKILNTPIIIQSSPSISIQTSQYQQQASSTINVQPNANTVTSLTPSQLQSLSYLMQTQITPQFIQTANGLIQIIPHGLIATQPSNSQIQNHSQDQLLSSQITTLPTLGWSLNNFNSANNQISIDNQLHQIQLNNLGIPQLIPLQQVLQTNNPFFNRHDDDQNQIVSTIVDLNANGNDKKSCDSANKKGSRRKRKQTNKLTAESTQLSSPLAHPTSTNEVLKEVAESSSGKLNNSSVLNGLSSCETNTLFDNKGRPFSFICPECPKKFTLNSRLNAHMRCHTGMRPFTCNVCAFSFTQKSYLIRHAAVHKEERPFHCEKCQKSYKHYGSLANHRKLHRKDEKAESELINDVKIEHIISYNGKPSSISSIVMNNCTEYSTNQSFESSTILPQDSGEPNNAFSISSSVHSTTGGSSYIKDLELYPMALSQISDTDKSSANVFFQSQQPTQVDQNYKHQNYGNGGVMLDLTSNNRHDPISNEVTSAGSTAAHQIFPSSENNRSSFIV